MPNVWDGTIEERLERLSRAGRRCDANSRNCTRAAVDEYDLRPADGNFIVIQGAEPVRKKSCGYHRAQFLANGRYVLMGKRDLPRKAVDAGVRHQPGPGKAA